MAIKREEKTFLVSLVATFLLLAAIGFQLNQDFGLTGNVVISFSTDYANCDANITCGFTNWSSGNYYCLNESNTTVVGTCFNITNSSLTLDLNGFNISGDGTGVGANGNSEDNLTIINGKILNFNDGIDFTYSNNATFHEIESSNNIDTGLLLGSNSNVSNSNFNLNMYGLTPVIGGNNLISNVEASNNQLSGVYMLTSTNNTLDNVITNNNRYGIVSAYGNVAENIITKNNTDLDLSIGDCSSTLTNITGTGDLPILFYNETINIINWNNNFSELILCNADNSTLDNITITNNNGILILDSNNITIRNLNSSRNQYGLYLDGITNSSITNATLTSSDYDGIYATSVNNTIIQFSTITNNSINGIYLISSNTNQIENNNIVGNGVGVYLSSYSTENEVMNNNFYNNANGIELSSSDSNQIANNDFENSSIGVLLSASDLTQISNNVIKNSTTAGVSITGASQNNSIKNNVFNSSSILDSSGQYYENFLEYSNAYGILEFTGDNFSQNLTTFGDLSFPGNIKVEEASMYVNSTAFAGEDILNSSADITMYLNPKFATANILHNGVLCTNATTPACVNSTRLTTKSPVLFNVTAMNGTYILNGTLVETTDDSSSTTTTTGADTFFADASLSLGNNYTKTMQVGDKLNYKVNGVSYNIELTKVSTSSVELTLSNKTSTVLVNQTVKFNANGDSLYDIQATLNSVTGANAVLTFFKINSTITGGIVTSGETTPATTSGTTTIDTETTTTEEKSVIPIWVISLIVMAILVVIGLIIYLLISGNKKDVVSVSRPMVVPRPSMPMQNIQNAPMATKPMQPQAQVITPQQVIAINGRIDQLLSQGNIILGSGDVVKAKDIYKQINQEYSKLMIHDEKLFLKISDFAGQIKGRMLPRY